MELFERIANVVVSLEFIAVYVGSLVLIAVGAYFIRFFPRTRLVKRKLGAALATLNSCKDMSTFVAQYEQFNDVFRENEVLGASWKEYADTLILPSSRSDKHRYIRNTVDPARFFNDHSLIRPRVNLRLLDAIPNYLTGLGILGTFIGLVAGIYLAGLDLPGLQNAATTAAAGASTSGGKELEGLERLLSGASLAFLTSIFGLMTSIGFSFFEKGRLHRIGRMIDAWNTKLDQLLVRVVPEQLANEQLLELERQSAQLERFNTDLAVSIAGAIDDRLAGSFGPKLERLVDLTEAMVANRAESDAARLEKLVEELKTAMTGAAGQEMVALKEALVAVGQDIRGITDGFKEEQQQLAVLLTDISGKFAQGAQDSAVRVSEILESATKALSSGIGGATDAAAQRIRQSGDEAANSLVTAGQAIDEVARRQEASSKSFERSVENLKALSDTFGETMRAMNLAQHEWQKSVAPVRESLHAVRILVDSIGQTSGKITAASESMTGSTEILQRGMETTSKSWSEYRERFEGLDSQLAQCLRGLQDGVAAISTQTQEYVTKVNAQLADALRQLATLVEELTETVDEISDKRGR